MHNKHLSEQGYFFVVDTQQTKPTNVHTWLHANTHTLFFLPPCTASGESSLYSRHWEMSAPCDRPVRSSLTDLCGTSLPLFLLWWRDYVCSLPIRKVYSARNGGAGVGAQSDRSREKSPCVRKLYDGLKPVKDPHLNLNAWGLLSFIYVTRHSLRLQTRHTSVFPQWDTKHWIIHWSLHIC